MAALCKKEHNTELATVCYSDASKNCCITKKKSGLSLSFISGSAVKELATPRPLFDECTFVRWGFNDMVSVG